MPDAPPTSTPQSSTPQATAAARAEARPADASARNWVDAHAPAGARPYLRLMRADRPVGVWLLFLPCLWGAALARIEGYGSWPQFAQHALLFAAGAIAMRGAGCAYNDVVDRDIDAKVARTAMRPIPAGQVTPMAAAVFALALCLAGLAVLVQFNGFTIAVGAASLALVAAYPFMKRITWWPQAWLGLTFNWGALVGYSAAAGQLSPSALTLYAAGVTWTLGYDTIYAHQDREDDALVGVRSSARALGRRTRPALAFFFALTIVLATVAAVLAGAPAWIAAAFLPAASHLAWQIRSFDDGDPAGLLSLFRSNREAGLLVLAALLLATAASAP